MGQRPFSELDSSKRLAVLYRDTKRLRWMVEQEVHSPIRDDEWLKILPMLVVYAERRVRMLRQP